MSRFNSNKFRESIGDYFSYTFFFKNRRKIKDIKEILFKIIIYTTSISSIVFLFGIIISIFKEGWSIFVSYGIIKFLFGMSWHPTHYPPEFGIFPLIMGSICITIGSLIVAIPLGLGSAIYVSEIANNRVKEILKPIIELLANIPSVVYGLVGMAFFAPLVQRIFNIPIGLNVFSASVILGIMIIPIISSVSEDALSTVPKQLKEGSYALGANKWETITKIIIPSAKTGIIVSIVLGFGRAIGETMVVLMIAGGSPHIPKSIFQSARPLTSAIASEMGEAIIGSQHYHSLFGIAIVLFIIIFITNLIVELAVKKKWRIK
ncbi:phosphate ABC transporter permease subunit PstC [candidate division WOR-3 bacterium]|jgi:phosphate transport system permease protein|nr:phosphate ABC transporter permease subunit PstC [candidate division WOR-3 bacterium]